MKDELSVITNQLKKMTLLSQIINRRATLNFQCLSDFYPLSRVILMQQDITELKICSYNGSVQVVFDESYDDLPAKIRVFYASYLKILFFRRVAKMKAAGYRIIGVPTKIVDMVLRFNSGAARTEDKDILLQVRGRQDEIRFKYDGETAIFEQSGYCDPFGADVLPC